MGIGKHIRKILHMPSNVIPASLLITNSKNIFLPTYHTVSDKNIPHIHNLYTVKTSGEFIQDIDFILKHFTPIDLQTLIRITANNEIPDKNYFHLSFDDGLRECYDVIMPILNKKGIPATFFLNPAFIDNKGLMHRYKISLLIEALRKDLSVESRIRQFLQKEYGNIQTTVRSFLLQLNCTHTDWIDQMANITETDFHSYLHTYQPYLSSLRIQELINNGFTIGAHSINHPEYIKLTQEEQLNQTLGSINIIQNTFDLNYRVFAFPFTDDNIKKELLNNIYQPVHKVDLTFGVAGLKKDVFRNLQRVPMEKCGSAKQIILSEYLYYYLKFFVGKNMMKRK